MAQILVSKSLVEPTPYIKNLILTKVFRWRVLFRESNNDPIVDNIIIKLLFDEEHIHKKYG
jgi:hypothetical protein